MRALLCLIFLSAFSFLPPTWAEEGTPAPTQPTDSKKPATKKGAVPSELEAELTRLSMAREKVFVELQRVRTERRIDHLLESAEQAAENGQRKEAEALRREALEIQESLMRRLARQERPGAVGSRTADTDWEADYWTPAPTLPTAEPNANSAPQDNPAQPVARPDIPEDGRRLDGESSSSNRAAPPPSPDDALRDDAILTRLATIEAFIRLLREGPQPHERARRKSLARRAARDQERERLRAEFAAVRQALEKLERHLVDLERRVDVSETSPER